MLDKVIPFALVLGLSSLALAGSPPARAPLKGQAQSQAQIRARAPAATKTQGHAHQDDRFRGVKLALASGAAVDGTVTVYVNGVGATLRGGFEDAASDRSSIVDASGFGTVELPAYAGGTSRWNQMMGCVDDQFRDFDLVVTDQRPVDDGYIMIMVGGSPADIGEGGGVAGIAPYTGSVLRGAVGFAFSEVHGGDVRGLCETVAHEIGHTLGLDHTYACADTMSYLSCGDKSFQDGPMSCGEWDERTCSSGSATQDSHAVLAGTLGLRGGGSAPPPEPAPEPAVEPAPEPEPGWDEGEWVDEGEWGDESDEWVEWVDENGDAWLVWVGGEDWVEWVDEGEWGVEWVDEVEWGEWEPSGCPHG